MTLKNGCTRKGPWESNKPVGDWYHDHHAHVSVTTAVGGRLGPVTARPHDEEVGPAVTPTTSGSNKRKKSSPTTAASSSRSRPSSGNADHDRTSSTIRARGEVAIKQEVIELLDSSSDEAPAVMQEEVEEEQPGEPSQQAVDAAVAFTNNTDQDEDEARIQEIHDWLEQDVIGNNPKPGTMKMYARSLYELGFESVDMITNTTKYLTEQHIDSFKWMKPLHKQMLNDYLHGNDI